MSENIVGMVNEDIDTSRSILRDYSHDKETMEKLFNYLLFKYIEVVKNIADGLAVISPYSNTVEMTSIYRENVEKIIKRLEMFKGNGYSNRGLLEYYIECENQNNNIDSTASISDIIIDIGMMDNIPIFEKEEIIRKLQEIDEISSRLETKSKKWELLRPYVLWLSGKDYGVAIKILPLFLRLR